MDGLNDIATSGAPGLVTIIGMGTVFLCLILLYASTRVIGNVLPRALAAAHSRATGATAQTAEPVPKAGDVDPPEDVDGDAGEEAIIAALTLVLSRHRAARVASVADEPRAIDPWKMAGRIRTLRSY